MLRLRALPTVLVALIYSSTIGYLVAGLFWQTFNAWLPHSVVIAIGGILGIRVATLFASMTAAAVLDWKSIWVGGGVGLAALVAWWPAPGNVADPPRILLAPILLATLVVALTAGTLSSPKTSHFYHSARFARGLHHLQGALLFGAALPASLVWAWTRPFVVALILSAFFLWRLWGGACPVTLTENAARAREGVPIMPPDTGFIPDALARLGFPVRGTTVTVFLYGIGLSLCGWFGLTWMF